ncbi:AAA family ATPase [Subtercola lobariae]|uniref:AAA family ATPase n=1 Tax=Subtercola lobariae TaxID=1588641 RepID=UPI001662DC80|nr:ATP-binding protein [Subtercola lobariae]
MQPEINPYSPGSGLTPPDLVGRQAEIDAFDLVVARSRGRRSSRGIILHGLRGVGKTVLLNRFLRQAEQADWFTVELEGSATESGHEIARHKLGRALLLAVRRLQRSKHFSEELKAVLGTVKSFSLSLGVASIDFNVDQTRGRADSGRIEVDFEEVIEDLVPALQKASSAFGLFIDEMQDIDPELMSALLAAQHKAGQKGWPFYIFGAGLPSLPSILSSSRSYAERLFNYREIGALDVSASRDALLIPAGRLGVEYEPEAISELLTASGGYPYFLQTYGQAAWDIAEAKIVRLHDAREAVVEGNAALDMGFFPARWDRATPTERNYLRAMAADEERGSRTPDIADRLGVPTSALSTTRQGLLEKGVVYSPERGRIAFTVPGMASFINRQSAEFGGPAQALEGGTRGA